MAHDQNNPQRNDYSSENINISCRLCKSSNTIKRGHRDTENRGRIQRYYCRDCKKRFVIDDGFFRMRNNPEKITCSLDLYFRGISLRRVQEHFQSFLPANSSHVSILRWIRKYSLMIGEYTEKLELNNSNEMMFDEMEYKTSGLKSWFIDVLDPETRYMVSSGFYLQRGQTQLRDVLISGKERMQNPVTDAYTDGLLAYPKLLRNLFGMNKLKAKNKINHHVIVSSKTKIFNWKIERLHNSIRERTKTMRNFKALHSAKAIMNGYVIYYNFVRKHQAIGKKPYQLATNLKLGKNAWLSLIRLSKNQDPLM